jgi:hypothetical protein
MRILLLILLSLACNVGGVRMPRQRYEKSVPAVPAGPKFCVDCQHFIPYWSGAGYAKCSAFPRTNYATKAAETNYLVSGVYPKVNIEYFHCSTAREFEDMCGKQGKSFTPKE